MSTNTTATQTMTIGQGRTVHMAYVVDGSLCGSLCNAFAWESSRVRFSDQPANCTKCTKAVHRAAAQVARTERQQAEAEQADSYAMCGTCGWTMGHSPSCPTTQPEQHTLTVFNAVDLPDAVASQVMALLAPYDPDVYTRDCDATGHAL